jgi:hypothetical protein
MRRAQRCALAVQRGGQQAPARGSVAHCQQGRRVGRLRRQCLRVGGPQRSAPAVADGLFLVPKVIE